MTTETPDPDEYVRNNRETLVEVVRHGTDSWVRALALAALVEYGGAPNKEALKRQIDRIEIQD